HSYHLFSKPSKKGRLLKMEIESKCFLTSLFLIYLCKKGRLLKMEIERSYQQMGESLGGL
ncbi:hypothetical protein, partial [Archaeoglobus fulgidus]|uniref:hypothetical protein n=1 Tax=Archaeoglobus fulgidus TaxID=2234 RepID=UPI001C5BBA32